MKINIVEGDDSDDKGTNNLIKQNDDLDGSELESHQYIRRKNKSLSSINS